MARILIIGRAGQVATSLARRLPNGGHAVEALGRRVLDLTNSEMTRAAIIERAPDIVINAAAYTAVDRAETDGAAAQSLNAEGPATAAAAADDVGAVFVHFSTDYVFDGSKGEPYVEGDATAPLGVYGRTKLAGECGVVAANPRHVILRTAWVCSAGGSNFLRTMLRLAAERDELSVVDDQKGRPTFANDLADVVAEIVGRLESNPPAQPWGIFHAVSQGDATWCEFARTIMEGSAARGGPSCPVKPITTANFPTLARRPADSRLSTDRLADVYDIRMPHWREALNVCLDEVYDTMRAER